jgi:hypothetical protein
MALSKDPKSLRQPKPKKSETASATQRTAHDEVERLKEKIDELLAASGRSGLDAIEIAAAILERIAKFLPEEEEVFILLPLLRDADAEVHEITDAADALEPPGRYARGCFVSSRYDSAAFLHLSRQAFLAATSDPEAVDQFHAATHDEDDSPAVQITNSGRKFH